MILICTPTGYEPLFQVPFFLNWTICNSQFPRALGPTEKHDGTITNDSPSFLTSLSLLLDHFFPLTGSLSYFLQIFNSNGDPITDDPNHNFIKDDKFSPLLPLLCKILA